jgi:tripartite-type tricarboxylate transporter receptor subunit TctC
MLSAMATGPAPAQSGRTITMMHGFPAGTNIDVVARLVTENLGPRLEQTMIVDPRPGAGGTVGAAAVARAPADGSVLCMVAGGHAIAAAIYNKLPYDPVEDFTFISMVQDFPFVLVTYPDHPAKSLADVIQSARAAPGKLSCATGGNGTGMHLAFELFIAMAGVKILHVPYRGTPQAYTDLIGKRIDFVVAPPSAVVSHIRNGTLRAIAVTGRDRFFKLPNIPPIGDTVKGYNVASWIGVAGPAHLPAPLVSRINTELKGLLADPEIVRRLREIEGDPQWTSPADFKARVVEDVAKWTKVVRDANIPRI